MKRLLVCFLAVGLFAFGAKPKRKLKNVDPIAGTVNSVSVVTGNGMRAIVANPTTNPAITLYTTVSGVVTSNGTAFSAAPTTGTGAVVLTQSPTITGNALFNMTQLSEQASPASYPSILTDFLYFKSNHNLYQMNPSGSEVQISGAGTGITSINSDTTAAQTLSVGTTGTNFAVVDGGGGSHTFNLPDASSTARGVVNTTTQTFNGNKTVAGSFTTTGTISGPAFVANIGPNVPVFTNSSSQLVAASTTGTGNAVLATTPTLSSPILVTPTGFIEEFTGHIVAPANYTYILDQSAAYAYTINTLIAQTSAGTATAEIAIGGTAVTGISALSLSSTPATGTATALRSVSIGNQVTLIVSNVSSAADLSFTLKYTR
jgi:hypothetical protein